MKTSKPLLLAVAALLALGTAGCSTPAARIRRNPEAFARLTAGEQTLIKNGQIGLGFTPEMVRLALGDPDHIHTRTDPSGTSEIWSYTSDDAEDGPGFYYGWYHHPRYWGWDGPFPAYPLYSGYGYRRERVDFRVVFQDGKAVAVEQRKR
jgi:hypothetical protein